MNLPGCHCVACPMETSLPRGTTFVVLRVGHSPPWPTARTPPSPRASTPPSWAPRIASLTTPAKLSHPSSACSVAPSVASLASSLSSVISRVSAAHQSSNKKRPVFPSAPANSLSLSRSRSMHLAPRRYLQLGVAHPPLRSLDVAGQFGR